MLSSRCKHCKERFTKEEKERRIRLHPQCVEPWLKDFQEKQKRKAIAERKAKLRVERAADRKKRERLKRIPDLIAEAQKAFNAYIRERDKDKPCICCGKPLGLLADDPRAATGGAFDCGHYRSTGSASHLRFDERNAHGQRKFCNRYGAGRAVDYRRGLIGRVGVEVVLELESSNTPHKWERDELIAIKALYVSKLKQLKGATQ